MSSVSTRPDLVRRTEICAHDSAPRAQMGARADAHVGVEREKASASAAGEAALLAPPDDLARALDAAATLAALDALTRAVWVRWSAGGLDDAAAQALAERGQARRAALKGLAPAAGARAPLPRGRFPAPRAPRRPDPAASLERRRRLAASGPMPPALAARFTTGELAALAIVADEIARGGDCRLPLGAVAARAGVSETTARNALRRARQDGLVTIEERPRRGLPNLTNVVRMVSPPWRTWIARRGAAGGGCKNPKRTDRRFKDASLSDRNPEDRRRPPGARRYSREWPTVPWSE